mmetsp:Transcript_53248/g.122369  ORF Transcript_53248/g.122369 Transcript_53248/m.122369 type:complete len:309 (+) Transcript_53248:122-1048(+)
MNNVASPVPGPADAVPHAVHAVPRLVLLRAPLSVSLYVPLCFSRLCPGRVRRVHMNVKRLIRGSPRRAQVPHCQPAQPLPPRDHAGSQQRCGRATPYRLTALPGARARRAAHGLRLACCAREGRGTPPASAPSSTACTSGSRAQSRPMSRRWVARLRALARALAEANQLSDCETAAHADGLRRALAARRALPSCAPRRLRPHRRPPAALAPAQAPAPPSDRQKRRWALAPRGGRAESRRACRAATSRWSTVRSRPRSTPAASAPVSARRAASASTPRSPRADRGAAGRSAACPPRRARTRPSRPLAAF